MPTHNQLAPSNLKPDACAHSAGMISVASSYFGQMSVGSTGGTPGISTDPAPAIPIPKAPRLSSSTSSSLTVFVDTTGDVMAGSAVTSAEIEARPNTAVQPRMNAHLNR